MERGVGHSIGCSRMLSLVLTSQCQSGIEVVPGVWCARSIGLHFRKKSCGW